MIKVYLIDDELLILELYKLYLRSEKDLDVVYFKSADKALNSITETNYPDVLITDLKMPKINGFQLVNELIKRGFGDKIKMAYCSAFGSIKDALEVNNQPDLEVNKLPFIVKPLNENCAELIREIHSGEILV